MSISFDDYLMMLKKVSSIGMDVRQRGDIDCAHTPCNLCKARVRNMKLVEDGHHDGGGYTCIFLIVKKSLEELSDYDKFR